MQRIEVKNFGPLKDINLDIKDYMVFIGPQASGKSTLAKLIYFFWKVEDKFREEILSTYTVNLLLKTQSKNIDYIENFKIEIRKLIFEFFPTIRNGKISFIYHNGYNISIDLSLYSLRASDDILLSEGFAAEIIDINQRIGKSPELSKLFDDKRIGINNLLEVISNEFQYNSIDTLSQPSRSEKVYIPAGRSLLSILSNSFTLLENNSLDYFNENFLRFTNKVRKFISSPDYDNLFGINGRNISESLSTNSRDIYAIVNKLSFDILKGDFHLGDSGDGIRQGTKASAYVVPLKHTSSGQQESAWLINTIQYLLFDSGENKYSAVLEEPETHLFTTAQRDITNLITVLSNQTINKTRLIITTHSPYVLATLNNSIKAFTTAQIENRADEVANILSKEFWINPENLFVGFMKKNEGEDNFIIEDIFDPELGLIDHESLDKVSDDIMKQFDELLDIQYSDD